MGQLSTSEPGWEISPCTFEGLEQQMLRNEKGVFIARNDVGLTLFLCTLIALCRRLNLKQNTPPHLHSIKFSPSSKTRPSQHIPTSADLSGKERSKVCLCFQQVLLKADPLLDLLPPLPVPVILFALQNADDKKHRISLTNALTPEVQIAQPCALGHCSLSGIT